MANIGKPTFLGRFVIDGTNDTMSVSGTPGSVTNGYYYYDSLTAAEDYAAVVQSTLQTIRSDNTTCTFSFTTGKFTITAGSGGNFTLAWTDTPGRDLLGFTGATTAITTSGTTGTNQGPRCWIPNAYAMNAKDYLPDEGHVTNAAIVSRSHGGVARLTSTNDDLVDKLLKFKALARYKVWEDSNFTNQAYKTFYNNTVKKGYRVRWYPDNSSTSATTDFYTYVTDEKTAKEIDAAPVGSSPYWSLNLSLHEYVAP